LLWPGCVGFCFVAEAALSARLLLSTRPGRTTGGNYAVPSEREGCGNRASIDLLVAKGGHLDALDGSAL
jgi:hypothetical protein